MALNHGNHGPHIPLGAVTHGSPGQTGQIKTFSTSSKPYMQLNGKRRIKPIRLPPSSGGREEIFIEAPSSGKSRTYK